MTGTAYKIASAITIIILVVLLVVIAAAFINCQMQQPKIIYRTQPTTPEPDAYIFHYRSAPVYDIQKRERVEGLVQTELTIKNRGSSGLITATYGAINVTTGAEPILLEEKQYYVKGGEQETFVEVWHMPENRNYVRCSIIKQELAD